MYPSEKNTNHLTVRGGGEGGSTLTVSLTVKYPLFFLTTSLSGDVTDAGRTDGQTNDEQGKIELLSQWMLDG